MAWLPGEGRSRGWAPALGGGGGGGSSIPATAAALLGENNRMGAEPGALPLARAKPTWGAQPVSWLQAASKALWSACNVCLLLSHVPLIKGKHREGLSCGFYFSLLLNREGAGNREDKPSAV